MTSTSSLNNRKRGFTLLELSIVLAIIGLIVGGIVAGESIVRTSKIQAMLREYDTFLKATQQFVDKYQALPGDMTTATNYWGIAAGCNINTSSVRNQSSKVCNGDGNGRIEAGAEAYGVWQQLFKAGLIDIPYSGMWAPDYCWFRRGINVPESVIKPGAWVMEYLDGGSTSGLWPGVYGNPLQMGAVDRPNKASVGLGGGGCFDHAFGSVLMPSEAYDIDMKMDDGKPGLGKIRTWNTHLSTPDVTVYCTIQDTSASAQNYNLSYTDRQACSLIFITGL